MKKKDLKKQHIAELVLSLVILALITFIAGKVYFRIDLTSEKRYSLSEETKHILENLDDIAYVKVYLEGDMPIGFKKFHDEIREMLDEFRIYAKSNIQYEFINPSESSDPKIRNSVYSELAQKGIAPVNIQSKDKEGGASEKILFPGALITFNGVEVPINLLNNNRMFPAEQNLNNSVQSLEYNLIKTIYTLSGRNIEKIAFLEGQDELDATHVADISKELSNYFQVDRGSINGKPGALDDYKAVIIAKPSKPFTEQDKFVIDQYIMKGGKVIWFVDAVNVSPDSLANGQTLAFINNINIDDQLFRYGVRINPNLVQDIQCNVLPVNTGTSGSQPRWVPAPWLYYPLISPLVDHPVTRNLNVIWARFASQIDTLAVPGIKKTVLLKTSSMTKLVNAPLPISLDEVKRQHSREEFNRPNQTVAVLLEGKFPSVFQNRTTFQTSAFKPVSSRTKMIVIADGDMISNDVRMTPQGPAISPLGYDKYTRQTFGNKDFIVNAVNYLTDESGLITLRAKEFKLRLLDKAKVRNERLKWQMINLVLPLVLIVLFGIYFNYTRKRKYARVK